MKIACLVLVLLGNATTLFAQEEEVSKARFVIGLSGPELAHAGLTYRIANASQLGFSAGAGPSWGLVWTTLNLEHRLYFAGKAGKTNRKTWFFRQGTTYFPAEKPPQQFTLNLTLGKDMPFKNVRNGFTLDAGVFYLRGSEMSSLALVKSLNLLPALRFEFYFSL